MHVAVKQSTFYVLFWEKTRGAWSFGVVEGLHACDSEAKYFSMFYFWRGRAVSGLLLYIPQVMQEVLHCLCGFSFLQS